MGLAQPMHTSLCFGGSDLKTLFIALDSERMGSDKAGAVFSLNTDAAGVAVVPARVKLG
jgi:sugar lactone lactonase YvrE